MQKSLRTTGLKYRLGIAILFYCRTLVNANCSAREDPYEKTADDIILPSSDKIVLSG